MSIDQLRVPGRLLQVSTPGWSGRPSMRLLSAQLRRSPPGPGGSCGGARRAWREKLTRRVVRGRLRWTNQRTPTEYRKNLCVDETARS